MSTKLFTLRDCSLSFKNLFSETAVVRDNLIAEIEDLADQGCRLVITEGNDAIGKTTLLLQFSKNHHSNSFTYFINPSCRFTFTLDYLMEDLGRQFYFFVTGNIPDDDMTFNESQFNTLLMSLLKKQTKKGQKLYFVIDGLDQIEKADLLLILPIINNLPFNTNNFYFVLSGEFNKLSQILNQKAIKNAKALRVTSFVLDEVIRFFNWTTEKQKEYAKEIHTTWRGHPDRLSQIKRILDNGTTIEEFLSSNEIAEKKDLLEAEWKQSNISEKSFRDVQIKIVGVLAFSESVRKVEELAAILQCDINTIEDQISCLSFLINRNEEVDFVSSSFRNFVFQKLNKYRQESINLLVSFYTDKSDSSSLVNLPQLLHKQGEYAAIVKLLTISNLTIILNNSQSFGEINRQINYGYKASTEIDRGYEELFRFSLYRSTILGIQVCETRENELEAYVRLDKFTEAERLISNAFLREDRLKILVKYLRELRVNTEEVIEDRYHEELKELLMNCDRSFIKENLIEIAVDLAYINPQLAISMVEEIAGQESSNSLEWLLGYLAFVLKRNNEQFNDSSKYPAYKEEDIANFVERFSESVEFSVKGIAGSKVIEEVEKVSSVKDKLFRIKGWLKENPGDKNIYRVIEYALNLMIQNSSQTKPSASTLYDIIKSLENIPEERNLRSLIQQVDNLTVTVNNPTVDKFRIQFAIIKAMYNYDEKAAEERTFQVMNEISEVDDCGVKIEIQSYCYGLVKELYDELSPGKEFIFKLDEMRLYVEETFDIFLKNTGEQYDEIKDVLKYLAVIDLQFAVSIAKRLNIQDRRLRALRFCVLSHSKKPIKEWNTAIILQILTDLEVESGIYNSTLSGLVSAAYEGINTIENSDKINFSRIVKTFSKVKSDAIKCILLMRSIIILKTKSTRDGEVGINFEDLIRKLKEHLRSFWLKIEDPLPQIGIGYKIASTLAKADTELAEEYLGLTENIAKVINIDNQTHISAFVESIKICIRVYGGLINNDKSFSYSKIESLINQVPSIRERVLLWTELAVRLYAAEDFGKTNEIVQKQIIPVIEKQYPLPDKDYLYLILRISASAIQLSHPESLKSFLKGSSKEQIDQIITDLCFVILAKKPDTEPYAGKFASTKLTFQEATNFIGLLERSTDDNTLYVCLHKVANYIKDNPSVFTREQKVELKNRLNELVDLKLPNSKEGIAHDGYLILSKAALYHLNLHNQPNDVVNFFDDLESKALKINNSADRAFTLCRLAVECSSPSYSSIKKKQLELINKAFDEAAKINNRSERMRVYEYLCERAEKISNSIFQERLPQIQFDLFKLDDSDLFPTFRNFIDLAYKNDKNLAQRWITNMDNDPARSNMVSPSYERYEELQLEDQVMEDYSFIGRIKDRDRMASVAWKMLGELNSKRRANRTIDKTVSFLYTGSKIPFFDTIPLFNFFIENAINNDSLPPNTLISFYNSACSNADLCFTLIGSINNKKVNKIYDYSVSSNSILVKPGMRDDAMLFIKKHVKNCDSKDIMIIDQYFSEKDIPFVRDISSWLFEPKITILTSLTEAKELDRKLFLKTWKDISVDVPRNLSIIKVWTHGQRSPFHDRWVVFYDKMQGVRLGTSINSIGNSISEISFISDQADIISIKRDVIVPMILNRESQFENMPLKYETFDIDGDL